MITTDQTLVCRDCGREFIFTAGEQQFYAERGFVPPTRCAACRAQRRTTRQGSGEFGTDLRPSSYSSQPRPMFPAICADCGRATTVPFEPRAGRAVYCRDCYQQHRDDPRY